MHSMHRYIFTFIIVFCLPACQPTKTAFAHISKEEIKIEQEYQRKLVAKKQWEKDQRRKKRLLKKQERLMEVSDSIATSAIDMCTEIADKKDFCVYKFKVIYSKVINAWTDGNQITVTSAMMSFAKNDHDLALVLGHEVAHNMSQHVRAKEINAMLGSLFGVVADAAVSAYGINSYSTFENIGTHVGALSYSQDMEREADYVGLYITYNAGYDIDDSADFWRKMSLRDLRNKESIIVATTHPTNPERFIALNKTVDEINYKSTHNIEILPTFITQTSQAYN